MGDFLLNFMAFLENINLVFSSFSKLSWHILGANWLDFLNSKKAISFIFFFLVSLGLIEHDYSGKNYFTSDRVLKKQNWNFQKYFSENQVIYIT
jgi:hypothetical protein